MRVAVVGPGAIGATYAAAAEEAGHEVLLCGRRAAPPPVIEKPEGRERALASAVLADPAAADGPVPWVLQAALSVPDEPPGAAFAELFDGGSGRVDVIPDFTTEMWRKLTSNAIAGLLAITRRRVEVFGADGIRDVALALSRECVAVGRADGARLGDDDAERILDRLAAMAPDMGTSILFDRLAGRPMEWDARNGVVRRLGARHGVPTPVSDVLVPLLAALDDAPA
jgi:2-dehydropantoate 2-reductase